MIIEHLLYGAFLITFGAQIGRALTLEAQARKTVEAIGRLFDEYAVERPRPVIHRDQEAVVAPPLILTIKQQCWQAHYEMRSPR